MRVVWLAWTYVWRVLVNLIALVAVIWVLGMVHERSEVMLVTLSGILYVSIRATWMAQTFWTGRMLLPVIRDVSVLRAMREKADLQILADQFDLENRQLVHIYVKLFINSLFLGLISLLCLYRFATTL